MLYLVHTYTYIHLTSLKGFPYWTLSLIPRLLAGNLCIFAGLGTDIRLIP